MTEAQVRAIMSVNISEEYVDNLFTYHRPSPAQVKIYAELREEYRKLGHLILKLVPNGEKQMQALNALHISSMQANAGIALDPEGITEE